MLSYQTSVNNVASCTGNCMTVASWSTAPVAATSGGQTNLLYYRFMPDGKGARMLQMVEGPEATVSNYFSCDACAPGLPPRLIALPAASWPPYQLQISDKGQPRAVQTIQSGAYALLTCDYKCELSSSWTSMAVTPATGGWIVFQLLPGDRPMLVYGSGSAVSSVVRIPN